MKNMKKTISILFLFLTVVVSSQTSYDKGYTNGFKDGYCYKIYGCMAPIPPIPPIPTIDENPNNFKDGYHRGFLDGRYKKINLGLNEGENYNSKNISQFSKREYGEYIEPYDTDFMLKAFEFRAKNQLLIQKINQNRRSTVAKTIREKRIRDEQIQTFYKKNSFYQILELEDVEFNIDKEATIYNLRTGWQIDDATPFFTTKNSSYIYKQWRGSINKRNLNIIREIDPDALKNPFFYNQVMANMGVKYRGTVFLNLNKKIVFYSMETTSSSNIKALKKHSKINRKIKLSKLENKPKGLIEIFSDKRKNRYLLSIKNSTSKYPYKNIIFDLAKFEENYNNQIKNKANSFDDIELNKLFNFLKSIN